MKIRTAIKIIKLQPENDPIGHRCNQRWVERWKNFDDFPPKLDHRIIEAIRLTDKRYKRKLKNEQFERNYSL